MIMLWRYLGNGPIIALAAFIAWLFIASVPASAAEVILYKHSGFKGASLRVTHSIPNLHDYGWGDTVSSIRILSGQWTLYVHDKFHGQNVTLGPGNYQNVQEIGFPNDALSSLRFIPQSTSGTVILYQHSAFQGSSLTVTHAIPNLHDLGWGDTVSSIIVLNGYWTFYLHDNYHGKNVTLGPGNYRRVQDIGFPNDGMSSLRPR